MFCCQCYKMTYLFTYTKRWNQVKSGLLDRSCIVFSRINKSLKKKKKIISEPVPIQVIIPGYQLDLYNDKHDFITFNTTLWVLSNTPRGAGGCLARQRPGHLVRERGLGVVSGRTSIKADQVSLPLTPLYHHPISTILPCSGTTPTLYPPSLDSLTLKVPIVHSIDTVHCTSRNLNH